MKQQILHQCTCDLKPGKRHITKCGKRVSKKMISTAIGHYAKDESGRPCKRCRGNARPCKVCWKAA